MIDIDRTFVVKLDVVGRYEVIVKAADHERAGQQAVNAMDQGVADIRWCDDSIEVVDTIENTSLRSVNTELHRRLAADDMLKALQAAEQIVSQHNLLSTAGEQERRDTIERCITWWNETAVPAIDRAEGRGNQ